MARNFPRMVLLIGFEDFESFIVSTVGHQSCGIDVNTNHICFLQTERFVDDCIGLVISAHGL
jgi:hypothetical protein